METAKTILTQLGGNRFIAMTGSYNFGGTENSLTMKLRRNKISASHLTITLDATDSYTMTFKKLFKNQIKTVYEISGVYNDMLQDIFTAQTGLYTTL